MSQPRALLEHAQREEFRDKKGKRLKFELRPGLTLAQFAEFEARWPKPLPPEVRDLLSFASGFTIEQTELPFHADHAFLVDFTGTDESVQYLQDSFGAVPCPNYMATDGASNGWAIDIDPDTGAWGISHDPPVILLQSSDFATFISDVLDLGRADRRSNVAKVRDFDFGSDPEGPEYEFSAPEARASGDPDLARFAAGLADNFQIYDLRARQVGMGFDWSPSSPSMKTRPEVVRDGRNLIFAVEQKPVVKRPGFFGRLFGRQS